MLNLGIFKKKKIKGKGCSVAHLILREEGNQSPSRDPDWY